MIFLCYPKCSTCQKARKYLDERGINYTLRDIKLENPTREELSVWHKASGLELKRFFNTSGLQYRALSLKDRLPQMNEEEMLDLLASDGMLVKRPLLIMKNEVLAGFKQTQWEQVLDRLREYEQET